MTKTTATAVTHTLMITIAGLLSWFGLISPAAAEKADRDKPAEISADSASTNDITQTSVLLGNVIINKGTLQIKALRAEIKRDIEGYQMIVATGDAAKPVTYKQKRDGLEETIEAQALRLDFDGKADTVILTDQAIMRRMAKGVQQDEVRGAVIRYMNQTEFYDVKGGPSSSQEGGRVRMILAPRTPGTPSTTTTPKTPATPEKK